MWPWLEFGLLAAIIAFAGYYLSYYADIIADKTGLGRNIVGVLLLATVTSLPELVSGVSAVMVVNDPNLAVGDVLGSAIFNLFLVFFLDLFYREGIVYSKATQGHILLASLGMLLLSYIGFSLLINKNLFIFPVGHVSLLSLFIPVFYFLSMRLVYHFEQKLGHLEKPTQTGEIKKAYVFCAMSAIVILFAGSKLPLVAEKITILMDWNSAFTGTLFLAFATSLPEIVVTFSAIKIKAVELAFSNLLGSNLFNCVILFIDDLFYLDGPILASVSLIHALTAFSAVMMTGLVLVALILPPLKRMFNVVTLFSLMILCLFVFNGYLVFTLGSK